jgi:hypothetical protein
MMEQDLRRQMKKQQKEAKRTLHETVAVGPLHTSIPDILNAEAIITSSLLTRAVTPPRGSGGSEPLPAERC